MIENEKQFLEDMRFIYEEGKSIFNSMVEERLEKLGFDHIEHLINKD